MAHPRTLTDWQALTGDQALSKAERQLIELRIPSGKPGKEGSEALQRYCAALGSDDVLTLVQLPKLDFQQQKSAWFSALDGAGVMLRVSGPNVIFSPPLIIDEADTAKILSALDQGFASL